MMKASGVPLIKQRSLVWVNFRRLFLASDRIVKYSENGISILYSSNIGKVRCELWYSLSNLIGWRCMVTCKTSTIVKRERATRRA